MSTLEITTADTLCHSARTIISAELQAINALLPRIDNDFAKACQRILDCHGRVIVLGIGKSGHIAKKIAATLASTGTPSYYIHPAEASHGDLGMLMPNDIALILSNSGETTEVLQIISLIKNRKIPIIAMTGNPQSTLAQEATIHLDVSVKEEAGALGLAPTSSTTVALVMGDALALTLLEARDFTPEDFARYHPGGSLGKQLLLTTEKLMHTGNEVPCVNPQHTISQALVEITSKRLGMCIIVDNQNKMIGIFTDGDLRRSLDQGFDIHTTLMKDAMTQHCKTIQPTLLAQDALTIMRQKKITSLVVLDKSDKLAGVLHMHDILRTGIS